MNSFYFFKKYYQGEYDIYSPFVAFIIEKLIEYKLYILPKNQKQFELYTKKGKKIGELLLESAPATPNTNSIVLDGLSALVTTDKQQLHMEQSNSEVEISKAINVFFKRVIPKTKNTFHAVLSKNFKSFYDNTNDEPNFFKSLEKLEIHFNNSIEKKFRKLIFIKWLFAHKILKEVIISKEEYISILKKDVIYQLLDEVLVMIEMHLDVVNADTLLSLNEELLQAEHFDIFLTYIQNELNEVTEGNHTESHFEGKHLSITRSFFVVKVLQAIKENTNIALSTSIGFDLVELILESEHENEFQILSENIANYYSGLCLLRNTYDIKHYLVDISILAKRVEVKQKSVFESGSNKSPTFNFSKTNLVIFDLIRYPTFKTLVHIDESEIKNNNKVGVFVKLFSEILQTIPKDARCLVLTNNHLMYNPFFKDIRVWVGNNFSGELFEHSNAKSLNPLIIDLSYNKNAELGYVKQAFDKDETLNKKIIEKGSASWVETYQNNSLPIFSTKNKENGLFKNAYPALFQKQRKLPKMHRSQLQNTIPVIKKPFSEKLYIVESEIFTNLENRSLRFFKENKFFIIGSEADRINKKPTYTARYPTFNYLEKLSCFPLFSKDYNSINITDYAYKFYKKRLSNYISEKFSTYLKEKDFKLYHQIEKLKKVTESLPVLYKFTLQLEDILESNKGARVSLITVEFYEILVRFLNKNKILKKGANERKRLLSTIEIQIGELKKLLTDFLEIENNCSKELQTLTKENLFYYAVAVTMSEQYQRKFGYYLNYSDPLMPFLANMWEWVYHGKLLTDAFEGALKHTVALKINKLNTEKEKRTLEQITVLKKIGSILINDEIEISGLPSSIWQYQLKGKSPVEWKVIQLRKQYKGKPLDQDLIGKIENEILRSCNIAAQVALTLNAINKLDFRIA